LCIKLVLINEYGLYVLGNALGFAAMGRYLLSSGFHDNCC